MALLSVSTATISNLTNNTGGTISGNNNQGISLRSGGSITSTLTNGGTISGRSAGIGMRGNGSGSPSIGSLTNSGTISALTSSPRGISMTNGASIGSLTNTGTISGRTVFSCAVALALVQSAFPALAL